MTDDLDAEGYAEWLVSTKPRFIRRQLRRRMRQAQVRELREAGVSRADARRAAFRPSSDAEARQRNTTGLLRRQTAKRLGIKSDKQLAKEAAVAAMFAEEE